MQYLSPLGQSCDLTLLFQNRFHEAIVDLKAGHVERNVRLGNNVHANGDGEEIIAIEKIALEDPAVLAEIAKLQLPEGTVVISDPWIYGECSMAAP
jgi:primary-amine oxidase